MRRSVCIASSKNWGWHPKVFGDFNRLETYAEVIDVSHDIEQLVYTKKTIQSSAAKRAAKRIVGILRSAQSLFYNQILFANTVRNQGIILRIVGILTIYAQYVDQVSTWLDISIGEEYKISTSPSSTSNVATTIEELEW